MRIKLLFLALSFPLFFSCNHYRKDEREIKRLNGRNINIEWKNTILFKDSIMIREISDFPPIKIVTYVDKKMCASCMISCLNNWWSSLEELNRDSSCLICIMDSISFIGIQAGIGREKYDQLYINTDCSFIRNNELESVKQRNRTFLLDKNNNIVLVGEPFFHLSLQKLYIKTIIQLIDNDGEFPM